MVSLSAWLKTSKYPRTTGKSEAVVKRIHDALKKYSPEIKKHCEQQIRIDEARSKRMVVPTRKKGLKKRLQKTKQEIQSMTENRQEIHWLEYRE